ncbi:TetR/AcrR family transcriptional regulator [Paenibacillus sp. NFR01]|uniref:TetR/AcrR family transcriptional regulator n=1 Tax=Paenibacillus sp. NFR01 TaxID=1566279 RepID=UPI0008C3E515|nr:TetR/AcrR family transcriptional regulator [Paenibacillus sp. NFR01]SEU11511.1 transcriptional regulator, TetR family [Paenibacillus sp. NFR01]
MRGMLNVNDPRVIRSSQLILDAFSELLRTRSFEKITIGDITKRAGVNRSTFYAHFPDKFSLVDRLLGEGFMNFVHDKIKEEAKFSEDTMRGIVIALCEYHQATNKRCIKSYDEVAPFIEKNIKAQLEDFIYDLLRRTCRTRDDQTLRLSAVFVTWSAYGATFRWNADGGIDPPNVIAEKIMPLLSGVLQTTVQRI